MSVPCLGLEYDRPIIPWLVEGNLETRPAATKFENRSSYPSVPLTLVLNIINISETAIYRVGIWHLVVGLLDFWITVLLAAKT